MAQPHSLYRLKVPATLIVSVPASSEAAARHTLQRLLAQGALEAGLPVTAPDLIGQPRPGLEAFLYRTAGGQITLEDREEFDPEEAEGFAIPPVTAETRARASGALRLYEQLSRATHRADPGGRGTILPDGSVFSDRRLAAFFESGDGAAVAVLIMKAYRADPAVRAAIQHPHVARFVPLQAWSRILDRHEAEENGLFLQAGLAAIPAGPPRCSLPSLPTP